MNTLEVIHLRMTGVDPATLAKNIRAAVEPSSEQIEMKIYLHERVETDLCVHLHREVDERGDQISKLGIQLASMLRRYGIVEHSVWAEALGPTDPSASPERS
ncbi:MAG: hypothetical protein HKO65_19875 [Gemmatimonadetes bacterium]|nr:hypothetical protein [Gemmatimonadota bacterium]NNM07363.1 hypothetical protein [Gemmatimonadota bacterium]